MAALSSYSLENFKAFGQKQTLRCAPITVVLGANSSGKSSLIQSVLLMKQSVTATELSSDALKATGQYVDLGNFKEFVFRHKTKELVSFEYTLVATDEGLTQQFPYTLRYTFRSRTVNRFRTGSRLHSIEFLDPSSEESGGDAVAAVFEPRYVNKNGKLTKLERPGLGRVLLLTEISTAFVERSAAKLYDIKIAEYEEEVEKRARSLQRARAPRHLRGEVGETRVAELRAMKHREAVDALALIRKLRIEDIKKHFLRTEIAADTLTTSLFFTGGDGACRMRSPLQSARDPRSARGLGNFWRNELINGIGKQFAAAMSIVFSQSTYFLRYLVRYIGPLREAPKRLRQSTSLTMTGVGVAGEHATEYLHKSRDLTRGLNSWMKEFDIGHQFRVVRSENDELGDAYAIRLVDDVHKVSVSDRDVGFGVSQVLPILVEGLLGAEHQLICIEQPELHLHPRLQAKVADFLVTTASERGVQYVVETHSELLVLRLQRLIKEKRIPPDCVSLNYVSKGDEGSVITEIRLDDDGEFLDPWPEGFFDEGFNERFGV